MLSIALPIFTSLDVLFHADWEYEKTTASTYLEDTRLGKDDIGQKPWRGYSLRGKMLIIALIFFSSIHLKRFV